MSRRPLAAGLAGALTATCLASGLTTGATASAAAPTADEASPLVLRSPEVVKVRNRRGWIHSDFGIRLAARGEAFELRATRDADYLEQITVVWKRESGDVALPADWMSTWQGLDRFATVRVLKQGKQIRRVRTTGCFNGDARKIGPAGPANNPYPWGCPWNPYTLGSVMGVAEDYSASLFQGWGQASMRLKPGRYRVVTEIAPRWREVFGISDSDGRTRSRLVVERRRKRSGSDGAVEVYPGRLSAQRAASGGTVDGRPALERTLERPAARAEGAMAPDFAPDLRSLPAFDISMNRKGTAIRFGATVWNGGTGPMVIEGFRASHDHERRRTGGEHGPHMDAYQYFFGADGEQTGYQQVGEFNYHAANHNHWHFEDFARYRLFRPAADNPDAPGAVAVRSTKASFCLVATDAVDYTVPNADWRPEYTDLSSQCGGRRTQMLRQVLANGSGDTYHQYRAGQALRVGNAEKVPDGIYYIGVQANPDDADGRNLVELDYANNDSYRKIRIFTRNGKRRVKAFPVGVVDESASGRYFRR